jgi:hypothetical protein
MKKFLAILFVLSICLVAAAPAEACHRAIGIPIGTGYGFGFGSRYGFGYSAGFGGYGLAGYGAGYGSCGVGYSIPVGYAPSVQLPLPAAPLPVDPCASALSYGAPLPVGLYGATPCYGSALYNAGLYGAGLYGSGLYNSGFYGSGLRRAFGFNNRIPARVNPAPAPVPVRAPAPARANPSPVRSALTIRR